MVAAPAQAATRVFYSVGTSVADLKAGAPTVTISAGTATFSIAQPNNVGVGDKVTYNGGTIAYISGRTSSTVYSVTTATGATPPNVAGVVVNQINRAFNLLTAAQTGSSNAAHLNTTNLAAANVQLNWPCYNDGLMDDQLTISGYTTGAATYIRVYTPVSTSEVGTSQRHRGLARTGFRLQQKPPRVDHDTITVNDSFVRIEGLEIDGSQYVGPFGYGGIDIESGPTAPVDHYVSDNIIYMTGTYTGVYANTTSAKVWNNVLHKVDNTTFGALVMAQAAGTAFFYNNTIYNHAGSGIARVSGTLTAKNNASMNKGSGSDFAGAMTQSNNVSGDATAAGAGSQINKIAYATYFKNTTVGSEDLHILNNSVGLWGSNGANLSADPSLPVIDDIDGGPRIQPDIGADEFGTCCGLSTTEVPGSTVTVTGAGQFELRFNTTAGGSIEQFFDLAEDPGKTLNLAGGDGGGTDPARALFYDAISNGVNYDWSIGGTGNKVDLLEATTTRVRVRQESFYQDSTGTAIRPGIKGLGDHTVYGIGRHALRWQRKTTSTVTIDPCCGSDLDLVAHATAAGPLSTWVAEAASGPLPQGPGEAFLLERSDYTATVPNVKTDFLMIMNGTWPQATGTGSVFWGPGSNVRLAYWIDNNGEVIPANVTQTWDFLTYFKPTNFASFADPAVTSRSADYRAPSALAITVGGPWNLASENTSADDYNEAEGAYLATLDPALGLTFRIDGSAATPRYKPFFKIRQWRSLAGPASVTLQGTPLISNVSYRADVKPISRAHFAQTIRWHSTLEDIAASLTSPDIGSPGSALGASAAPGRYGNGFVVPGPAGGTYLEFQTLDFDPANGAVEFWYRPDYASNDSADRYLAGFQQNPNNLFYLLKAADNNLYFTITAGGTTSTYTITAANFSWRAADWIHLRMEWNDSVPCAPNCVGQQRILIYGVEPPHTDSTVDYNSASLTFPAFFRIGSYRNALNNGSATLAGSLYDEPYVYGGSSTTPTPLAGGGLPSNTNEYLADPTRNFSLAFAGIDATKRGQYLYLGADSQFLGLNVGLAVKGTGVAAGDLDWEYWNGNSWVTMESGFGFTDNTNSFTKAGNLYWTDLLNWSPYSINGGPDLYYVRAHLKAGTNYTVSPTEGLIKTDILLFQYCGDIIAPAQQFVFAAPVPTAVTLQSFTATAGDSAVDLAWATASELQNLGFHLYRSLSSDGPWDRITSSLIAGLGSSATGQSYSYRDGGLVNGRTYYYELEDIETTGHTERHGPVSATPNGAAGGSDHPPVTPPGPTGASYGDPSSVVLREVERSPNHVVLELRTGGFLASPAEEGRVRLRIPGFESASRPGEPELPMRRAFVEAVSGRKVRLTSILPSDELRFPGLRPVAQGAPGEEVDEEGTVLASEEKRQDGPSFGRVFPETSARLLGVSFQRETKKAELLLSPLRWDGSGLTLSRRLLVRLEFSGTEAQETSRGGSQGRRRVEHSTFARTKVAAQIAVKERGLYRVDYEDVFPPSSSLRPRGLPATSLRLSRQGESVAFHLEPAGALFAPGSSLYFLSEGADLNPYGDAVYELKTNASGLLMGEETLSPSTSRRVGEYLETVRREENHYYQSGLLEAPDLWQWDIVVSPGSKSFAFTTDHVAASSSTGHLSVVLQGVSDFPEVVDHHVKVRVNGVFVGETTWDGATEETLEMEVPAGAFLEGANGLSIEDVGDTGASYSMVFLNRFSVSYPRRLVATQGKLEGRFESTGPAEIGGASAASFVLDTTGIPRWLRGASAIPTGLSVSVEAGKSYLVTSNVLRPTVKRLSPSSLKNGTNQADYLLLAPLAFLPSAQPLLDLRESQGLVTKAVSLEEIYEQFGHGEVSPEAIKEFLEYAYHFWAAPSPHYVLLLGDASYDPKDYLQTGVKDWLPGFPVRTSYIWTVSDPAYASVNGADLLPDLAIGRLPAGSVDEAQRLVQKVLAYENGGGNLDGPAVLVADNADLAGNFEADADEIASTVLAPRNPKKIYYSVEGANTRTEIEEAFDAGASLMSYVGHGGTAVWASENIFNYQDVNALAPQSRQPLLMTMNCLNGFFQFPPLNSLSEALLKADGKGVVAAFSPSGLSVNDPAHVFHKGLLQEIVSGQHERIGDAVLAAQEAYAQTGAFPELLSIYHLFGDPALRIR